METKQSTQIKGAITEQKCLLKCIESGYIVSRPLFDNARYDFLLDVKGKILRIQVKTSRWYDEEHSAFIFSGTSQHSISGGNKILKYTNKEIDFFMTEKDDVFYLYPATDEGFREKRLRILPTKTGQTANITFAKDYVFEEVIKNF